MNKTMGLNESGGHVGDRPVVFILYSACGTNSQHTLFGQISKLVRAKDFIE